ncbi:helix-turn-helix domain-containing protein [Sphingomonas sp. MMSM20]|uniref:helix-turn-helix domain-containing protein n=1 Tax=Sphingomonas lycopersici TaxID=2951807 RepID=UPI002237B654|nr:helix-turn-helix domain-containing protein [Sphingomonas lycopersici]MCW6529721.1 helix-turn-helix domain-containing protein [Sphingomonas lycopersici]
MPSSLPDDKLALTISECVAAGLGSRAWIYDNLKTGTIKAVKRGRRTVILRSEAARYLATLPAYEAAA